MRRMSDRCIGTDLIEAVGKWELEKKYAYP